LAQKSVGTEVLFDPFEEQLHLPTLLVKFGRSGDWQGKLVGQQEQGFSPRLIEDLHSAQRCGITPPGRRMV
jgi:hypothetical protein